MILAGITLRNLITTVEFHIPEVHRDAIGRKLAADVEADVSRVMIVNLHLWIEMVPFPFVGEIIRADIPDCDLRHLHGIHVDSQVRHRERLDVRAEGGRLDSGNVVVA